MFKKSLIISCLALYSLGIMGGTALATDKQALSPRNASIVTIAAFTAQGDLENLRPAIKEALDNGMTINEAKEIMLHLYAYCGFPRCLNGLSTLISVIEERKAAGIQDTLGREPSPIDPKRDRLANGTKIQTQLVGRPISGKTYDFAPYANTLLREHLFSDLFERDVLTFKERELATVGALAGIGNVNNQLTGHMRCSLNAGVSDKELWEAVALLKTKVSEKTGSNAQTVLEKVLQK